VLKENHVKSVLGLNICLLNVPGIMHRRLMCTMCCLYVSCAWESD